MTDPQSDPQNAAVARTPAQRGAFGRWLTRVRTERYDRQVDALDAMRRLAGLHISQAEFSQWESGSRVPRPDNPKVARLYEFFGSRPEDDQPRPGPEDGDIAAAIRDQTAAMAAQTAAITALVGEIRVAALTVLSAQAGTGDLLAQLVTAAEQGTLGELVRELRATTDRGTPGRS